jgi:hypothetical protein
MSTHDDPVMTAATTRGDGDGRHTASPALTSPRQRRTTETKAAFKTTELMAYVAAVAAVLIAGMIIDQADAGGLGARQVWLYVTILTVGYMLSRGLAKSGSRDPYWDDDDRSGRHDGR